MSAERILLLVCGLACGVAAAAAGEQGEEPAPDAEFLEYLGMWEESDEEWMLHDGLLAAENEERTDPAPDGEASTENEDES
jgi:hypothetical protein